MNLEGFDEDYLPAIQNESDRIELEAQQTGRMQHYRRVRDIIVTPEVAKALRDNWSYEEIASVLGVSVQSVIKHSKSVEMQHLIDRENRRILDHLTDRDLGKEKYRDLVLSMGVLIDKARLLRDEPTEIKETREGIVDRLEILLFGPTGGRDESAEIIETVETEGEFRPEELPVGNDESRSTENPEGDISSNESGGTR